MKSRRITPASNRYEITILDGTPGIIARHVLGDEQLLLAKVRHNRLIDLFLRVTAYSLQNRLRGAVPGMGQIETDEVYVGARNTGERVVIPVQANGGRDPVSFVQVQRDLALCKHAFPDLTARPVAVQFKRDERGEVIVMFEVVQVGNEVKVVDEKHYRLVPDDSKARAALVAGGSASDEKLIVADPCGRRLVSARRPAVFRRRAK